MSAADKLDGLIVVWISKGDPRWQEVANRYEKATGHPLRPIWSSYSGDKHPGVFARAEWIKVIGGEDVVYKNGKRVKWAASESKSPG